MGMLAHYYQIEEGQTEKVLNKICLSNNDFYELISSQEGIQCHLDVDKSWQHLVEVFKDIEDYSVEFNIGEVVFYGKEFDKSYETEGLLNYSDLETIKIINEFLEWTVSENKDDFIKIFNSTQYTRFGEIDYSEYYDYLFLHLKNLRDFYLQCEKDNSGVIVSIG